MNTTELFNYYVAQLPNGRPATADDIKAAVNFTTGDPADLDKLLPLVSVDAKRFGINPEKELVDLYIQTETAQKEKQAAQQKEIFDSSIREMERLLGTLKTATPEMLPDILKQFDKYRAGLNFPAGAAGINRFVSWNDIDQAWKKDKGFDFKPDLFGKIAFPDGTVSYIGARTGRGKTTAMINLGIDALYDNRNVLFISLEESPKQIVRRFALCKAYRDADPDTREKLLRVTDPFDSDKKDPKAAYKSMRQGFDLDVKKYGNEIGTFLASVKKSNADIQAAMEKGKLKLFDGIGASLPEIVSAINTMKKSDVVLLDYIQKIPAEDQIKSGNPDLVRIRDGSEKLIEGAKNTECVIIAGAQFNRSIQKGKEVTDDTFNDTDFRGCGDLEQDGHVLIGIGRGADQSVFYEVIKNREGELTNKQYIIDFAGGYSFMGNTNEAKDKSIKQKGNSGKKKQENKNVIKDWLTP